MYVFTLCLYDTDGCIGYASGFLCFNMLIKIRSSFNFFDYFDNNKECILQKWVPGRGLILEKCGTVDKEIGFTEKSKVMQISEIFEKLIIYCIQYIVFVVYSILFLFFRMEGVLGIKGKSIFYLLKFRQIKFSTKTKNWERQNELLTNFGAIQTLVSFDYFDLNFLSTVIDEFV